MHQSAYFLNPTQSTWKLLLLSSSSLSFCFTNCGEIGMRQIIVEIENREKDLISFVMIQNTNHNHNPKDNKLFLFFLFANHIHVRTLIHTHQNHSLIKFKLKWKCHGFYFAVVSLQNLLFARTHTSVQLISDRFELQAQRGRVIPKWNFPTNTSYHKQ